MRAPASPALRTAARKPRVPAAAADGWKHSRLTRQRLSLSCCAVWADYLIEEAYYQREQEAEVGLTETQNPLKWETQAKGQNWFLKNMCCPMFEAIHTTIEGFEPWVGNSRKIAEKWTELEQELLAEAAAAPEPATD